MLAMTRLDTYKSIEHFAKDPTSAENLLSLAMLRRRTEIDASWHTLSVLGPEELAEKVSLYMGAVDDKGNVNGTNNKDIVADLVSMNRDEQIANYIKLCKEAGIDIDPQALLDKAGNNNERK